MNKLMMASALVMVISTVATAKENTSADAQAVNGACSQDAVTASCGDEKVGTGLLKCLHAYKKSHKDYKFSDSCKASMKEFREDHKERREAKKEEHKVEVTK
jgi:cytochrome c2